MGITKKMQNPRAAARKGGAVRIWSSGCILHPHPRSTDSPS